MTGAAQMLTVRVPLAVRKQRGGRKLMIAPASTTNRGASAADTTLVKALARAFRWRRMLEAGRYSTINELAAAEKINSSYVSRLLRLTLLAPDIVEAILDGRQPDGMTLPGLMEPFPVEWERATSCRCVADPEEADPVHHGHRDARKSSRSRCASSAACRLSAADTRRARRRAPRRCAAGMSCIVAPCRKLLLPR